MRRAWEIEEGWEGGGKEVRKRAMAEQRGRGGKERDGGETVRGGKGKEWGGEEGAP